MSKEKVLNAAMIEQILALLPPEQHLKLFALTMSEAVNASDEQVEEALVEALASIDWKKNEKEIRALIGQIMPLETLVPRIYREWRPVVRDVTELGGVLHGRAPGQATQSRIW